MFGPADMQSSGWEQNSSSGWKVKGGKRFHISTQTFLGHDSKEEMPSWVPDPDERQHLDLTESLIVFKFLTKNCSLGVEPMIAFLLLFSLS